MKKTYSKPNIVFENFSLCTSVAAACKIMSPDTGLVPEGAGGVQAGWFVVFQNTTQGCSYIQEDGYLNGFCYHNPADFNDVFYS